MFDIYLELTRKCNLSCKYCFENGLKDNLELSFQEAIERIEIGLNRALRLKQHDIFIQFSGGEPLLKFQLIKDLVNYISFNYKDEFKFKYSIITNGTLFDKDVSYFCMKNHIIVKLSLDGAKTDHDFNRITKSGIGSYELIMRNLDNLLCYQRMSKNMLQVSMVISEQSYKNFYDNFVHIINKGFRYISDSLDFNNNWTDEKLDILEGQFTKCLNFYYSKNLKGEYIYWKFIEDGVRKLKNPRKHYFCGAGITQITINTKGYIRNCSICQEELNIIGTVKGGFYEEKIKPFGHYKRNLSVKCKECNLNKYCSSCDCIFLNRKLTGYYNQVPDVYCKLYKINYKLSKNLLDMINKNNLGEVQNV